MLRTQPRCAMDHESFPRTTRAAAFACGSSLMQPMRRGIGPVPPSCYLKIIDAIGTTTAALTNARETELDIPQRQIFSPTMVLPIPDGQGCDGQENALQLCGYPISAQKQTQNVQISQAALPLNLRIDCQMPELPHSSPIQTVSARDVRASPKWPRDSAISREREQ